MAVHAVADGQTSPVMKVSWLVAAPDGTGAVAAVHDDRCWVSSSPWPLPAESV
jgi:hypothetical protein